MPPAFRIWYQYCRISGRNSGSSSKGKSGWINPWNGWNKPYTTAIREASIQPLQMSPEFDTCLSLKGGTVHIYFPPLEVEYGNTSPRVEESIYLLSPTLRDRYDILFTTFFIFASLVDCSNASKIFSHMNIIQMGLIFFQTAFLNHDKI